MGLFAVFLALSLHVEFILAIVRTPEDIMPSARLEFSSTMPTKVAALKFLSDNADEFGKK